MASRTECSASSTSEVVATPFTAGERSDKPPYEKKSTSHNQDHFKSQKNSNRFSTLESREGRSRRNCHQNRNSNKHKRRSIANKEEKKCCSVCNEGDDKYKCPKCRATYCSIKCCREHKAKFCTILKNTTQDNEQSNGSSNHKQDCGQQHQLKRQKRSKYLPTGMELPTSNNHNGNNDDNDSDNCDNDENDDLEEGWKMTKSMMDSIGNCSWLHKELEDEGLRHVIKEIVSASSKNVVGKKKWNRQNNKHRRGGRHQHVQEQQQGQDDGLIVNGVPCKTEQELVLQNAKSRYPNFSMFIDKLLVITGILERENNNNSSNSSTGIDEWLDKTSEDPDQMGDLRLVPIKDHRMINRIETAVTTTTTIHNPQHKDKRDNGTSNNSSDNDDDDDDNTSTSSSSSEDESISSK